MGQPYAAIDDYLAALRAIIHPIRSTALPRTLDPMRDLLSALDDPQQHVSVIMVAGSTGKGTTAWRLAHRLPGRIGLYLSPHLHSFRERLRSDGQMITRADFTRLVGRVLAAADRAQVRPSTFEAATALAYLYFAEQQVDTAVMEIGLGGRFDAVNVTPARLAVITPIEIEHAAMLGGSIEAIAWHKAGIIPPGGVVISAPQSDPVRRVLQTEADASGAALTVAEDVPNAALAALGVQPTERPIPPFPGRLERVERIVGDLRQTIVIDGGHTPTAARFIRDQALGDAPAARVIIGMLRDKDAAGFVSAFDRPGWAIEPVTIAVDRGLSASELAAACRLPSSRLIVGTTLEDALDRAGDALILVAGSLRLAAAAREHLGLVDPDLLPEARATRTLFEGAEYRRQLDQPPGSR